MKIYYVYNITRREYIAVQAKFNIYEKRSRVQWEYIDIIEKAVQVLGFTGNAYMNMASDAERYAALEMLRGARVMATVRKRITGQYINYTVSELEVVTM